MPGNAAADTPGPGGPADWIHGAAKSKRWVTSEIKKRFKKKGEVITWRRQW